YISPEQKIFAVDPNEDALNECRKYGLTTNLFSSDYYPTEFPFDETCFDLIYAFSVFTHTSERATHAALRTLRRHISPRGLLVITVRPVEYWDISGLTADQRVAAKQQHRGTGFAFVPHNWLPIGGDLPYGDTSIAIPWLKQNFSQWRV